MMGTLNSVKVYRLIIILFIYLHVTIQRGREKGGGFNICELENVSVCWYSLGSIGEANSSNIDLRVPKQFQGILRK